MDKLRFKEVKVLLQRESVAGEDENLVLWAPGAAHTPLPH